MKLSIKNAGDEPVVVLAGDPFELPRLAATIVVGETQELEVPNKHVVLLGSRDALADYLPALGPQDHDFSKEV